MSLVLAMLWRIPPVCAHPVEGDWCKAPAYGYADAQRLRSGVPWDWKREALPAMYHRWPMRMFGWRCPCDETIIPRLHHGGISNEMGGS